MLLYVEIAVEMEPNVKLECFSMFCCLGDTLGAGGGVEAGGGESQSEIDVL